MTYSTPSLGFGVGLALLLAPTPGFANSLDPETITEPAAVTRVDAPEPSLVSPAIPEGTLPQALATADPSIIPALPENPAAEPQTSTDGAPAALDVLPSAIPEADGQASTVANLAADPLIRDVSIDALTTATTFSATDLGWVDAAPALAGPTDVSQSVPSPTEATHGGGEDPSSTEPTSSEAATPSEIPDPTEPTSSEEITPSDDLNSSEDPDAEPGDSEATEASGEVAPSVWHFSFEPFMALPLNTRINSTTRDVGIDIDIDIGDVASSFNRLNFAFLGKFEAWYENQGVVLNTEYFAAGGGRVREFRVPPRLQGILPGTLTADFSADLLKADLMYARRFSAQPENGYGPGFSEFDLPPVSFDLMGGLRLYWLAQEATLTSGLGRSISQSSSTVLPEPVIRGRLRWNTSDNLALKLDTNISGFGAGDFFTFSVSALTAFEWMFSGNTSLSVGYQINHVNFNRSNRDDGTSNINLTSHGPYLSFLFRF